MGKYLLVQFYVDLTYYVCEKKKSRIISGSLFVYFGRKLYKAKILLEHDSKSTLEDFLDKLVSPAFVIVDKLQDKCLLQPVEKSETLFLSPVSPVLYSQNGVSDHDCRKQTLTFQFDDNFLTNEDNETDTLPCEIIENYETNECDNNNNQLKTTNISLTDSEIVVSPDENILAISSLSITESSDVFNESSSCKNPPPLLEDGDIYLQRLNNVRQELFPADRESESKSVIQKCEENNVPLNVKRTKYQTQLDPGKSLEITPPSDNTTCSFPQTTRHHDRKMFGPILRTPWTSAEKQVACKYFQKHLQLGKNAKLWECTMAIKTNSELRRRSPQQLKTWINNQILKNQRTTNNGNKGRKIWSTPEKKILQEEFTDYYDNEYLPSSAKCQEIIERYPILKDHQPAHLKAKVNNDIRRKQREEAKIKKLKRDIGKITY